MDKKLIAEFLGTFILSLVVVLSLAGDFVLPTPLLAALTLAFFVYTIGPISGSHINPAVTIGLWSIGKIDRETAWQYVAVQCIGSAAALVLASTLGTAWPVLSDVTNHSYLFEFLGVVLFTFGIGSVVLSGEKFVGSSIVIGASLLLGISVSVLGGGPGILNPAVAIALKTSDVIYYVVEIVGALVGLRLASYLFLSRKKR